MKKSTIALLSLTLGVALWSPKLLIASEVPLRRTQQCSVRRCLGTDELLWNSKGEKQALLRSINNSLGYLDTPTSAEVYENYPVPGVTHDRVRRSLVRFRELLMHSSSKAEFQAAIDREFEIYKSVGKDGRGTVMFTGYFEPLYRGSRTRTREYRYPLYGKPTDFDLWSKPHPTRAQLEGYDGLGGKSPLAGNEVVWLRDRMEAYLVQVQGSARIKLTNGETISVGYAGSTDYPYVSIGGELIKDGVITRSQLSLPRMVAYLRSHPGKLNEYASRNNRFIFFRETHGAPPMGNINVPVTANRSIATDKDLMPPGALAVIRAPITDFNRGRLTTLYVLDQDTGSAIKTPGRVDIFMGSGPVAGDRAGKINGPGELYYLLLKN